MTTRNRIDWLSALTWGGVTLLCVAIMFAGAFAAGWLLVHVVDWFATVAMPAIVAWANGAPNQRDVVVIGVLALLALLAGEIRK